MKKIEMSLETARKMYKTAPEDVRAWLLENFTKEELEKKRGFTWEDIGNTEEVLYTICSWGISAWSCHAPGIKPDINHFKTQKQAESALAFAQLSHIVAKYNEGKDKGLWRWAIYRKNLKLISSSCDVDTFHLEFYSEEDAKTSLEVNRELWEQYWMI